MTASGRPFWEALGVDDSGLPAHLPIGLTADDQGPADGSPELHHYGCWCGAKSCPLNLALRIASDVRVIVDRDGRVVPPPVTDEMLADFLAIASRPIFDTRYKGQSLMDITRSKYAELRAALTAARGGDR